MLLSVIVRMQRSGFAHARVNSSARESRLSNKQTLEQLVISGQFIAIRGKRTDNTTKPLGY